MSRAIFPFGRHGWPYGFLRAELWDGVTFRDGRPSNSAAAFRRVCGPGTPYPLGLTYQQMATLYRSETKLDFSFLFACSDGLNTANGSVEGVIRHVLGIYYLYSDVSGGEVVEGRTRLEAMKERRLWISDQYGDDPIANPSANTYRTESTWNAGDAADGETGLGCSFDVESEEMTFVGGLPFLAYEGMIEATIDPGELPPVITVALGFGIFLSLFTGGIVLYDGKYWPSINFTTLANTTVYNPAGSLARGVNLASMKTPSAVDSVSTVGFAGQSIPLFKGTEDDTGITFTASLSRERYWEFRDNAGNNPLYVKETGLKTGNW